MIKSGALLTAACSIIFLVSNAAASTVTSIILDEPRPIVFGTTFSEGLLIAPSPSSFVLSDGTTIDSGAGTFFTGRADIIGTRIEATSITYTLSTFQYDIQSLPGNSSGPSSYSFSNFSEQNSISASFSFPSTLELSADVGSNVAVISTLIEVVSKDFTDSNITGTPLAASVGDFVPLTIQIILENETFDEGTFARLGEPGLFNLGYSIMGSIDLDSDIVPLPAAGFLFVPFAVAVASRRAIRDR